MFSVFSRFISAAFLLFLMAFAAECVSAQTNKLPVPDAGNLVGFKQNGTMSADQINRRIKTVFGASAFSNASKAVDLYKINYRSNNAKGSSVILSGLLAVPQGEASNGLVIFNHGTTADRDNSPSKFKGAANSSETEQAILAFTSGGYAVALPDYLGLGDEKSFHPYPLGEINSRSAIDLIQPARTVAARNKIALGSRLFITGYSEGGAVAMWTIKKLEKESDTEYDITAAAAMSGPYDLSGTTREWLLAAPTNQEEFVIRLYLLSYIVQSFHKNEGVKLTEYFKPTMALTIAQAYKTNRSDETIIKRLAVAAALMRSKNSIENVLTERFIKALQNSDTSDPVVKGLKENDVYDWSPRTPLLIISLEEDKIVDPGNSAKAFQKMRGGGNVRQFIIKDKTYNHITGVAPALVEARRFFDEIVGK